MAGKLDSTQLEIHRIGKPSDYYLKVGRSGINAAHQFYLTRSEVYHCDEYVIRLQLTEGKEVAIVHGDGRKVPDPEVYNQIFGPGITLNGAEAVADFEVKDAIVCPVEGEDIVYNFVSEQSKVYFRGKTGKYTLFVRIYDNNTGNDNDRWVVLSAE